MFAFYWTVDGGQACQTEEKNAHQCCYISSYLYGGFVYTVQIKKKRQLIMYAPMEERDKNRIDYLNTRIYEDNTTLHQNDKA